MRIAILQESWLTHPEVGVSEVAVLAILALHGDREGICWPSQGLVARLLGKSRPWVVAVIGRLVEIGILVKTHRARKDGGERSCLYQLVGLNSDSHPTTDVESPSCQTVDRDSQTVDRPCHGTDTNKDKPEIQQDALPASAAPNESISEVEVIEPPALQPSQSAKVATTPNADWQPTDADLLWMMDSHPEVDPHVATEKFVMRCIAKGYRYIDLSAAFRVWVIEDEAARKSGTIRTFGKGRGQARYDAWASVAARHAGSARYAA